MKRAIVGYTGFVGLNLLQFYNFNYFYNSKNFNEAKNAHFDELFFCGIPAVKWHANKFPKEDMIIIENIKSILKTITAKKIILISTIDVYEYTNDGSNEDYMCDIFNNHPYGANRCLFEEFIKEQFNDYNIIRLPALFGKSLKKNMIYDLLNNNEIENISLYSTFQWYDLNWLKNDIDLIIKHNIKICNLFPEPLSSLEIIQLFNYPIETFKNKTIVNYNIKTKYSPLFDSLTDGYIRDKTTVLHNLRVFLNFQKTDKSNLVVSNICVKTISQLQFSCILKLFGIQNVQIAPTTLIENWNELPNMNLDVFTNNNINIYSFQSITYGLNHLNIFDVLTNDALFQHITKVIDYGVLHKIKVFVFGCPKNRKILKLNETNDEIFCNFFKKIGEYIGENDLTICIEPNSKNYGCNYINTIKEAGNLVNKINNKNIKMMVDIGNALMENDDLLEIYNFKHIIYNIDFSNKNMEPLTHVAKEHKMFIKTLREINYNKKINLEMLITNENELDILIKSLNNLVNIVL